MRPAAAGSVFTPLASGTKVVSPMKTTMEQSSEALKSPVLPVTAEVVAPHEAETVADVAATPPVKTSEAATLEAEEPKESVVETEEEGGCSV